jgi:uncharacterized protein YndB with AHSA1/START domain
MTRIAHEVVVSCPPDRVFALLTYDERLPEFSGMTVEAETDKLVFERRHKAEHVLAGLKALREAGPAS